IVGTCKDGTPNQLPAWTSYRFAVFLERDPSGLPPYLNGTRKKAAAPLRGSTTSPEGDNGGPAQAGKTKDEGSKKFALLCRRNPGLRRTEWPYRTQHHWSKAVTPAWKRGSSLTSEQLEAARSERMRQNGLGAISQEDARTWLEETGLCLFLPK